MIAVFLMSAGSIGIWWYPRCKSSTKKTRLPWRLEPKSCISFFFGWLGSPPSGRGEQSPAALIFPTPCPRPASASGGTRRVCASVSIVCQWWGWSKLRAVCMETWFANFIMSWIFHSLRLVASSSRMSHLLCLNTGHSFSMCGKVSSSSSQNLHSGDISFILL